MPSTFKPSPATKRAIKEALGRLGARSLQRADLERLLTLENCAEWKIPSFSAQRFANELVNAKLVSEARLEFPSRTAVRYLCGRASPYEVAQSISREGYLSHFTALHLHQLTDQLPKTIYFNVEQNLSPGGGELQQALIDRTFKRPCRITHNVAVHGDLKIAVLNGGNTGCLGVDTTSSHGSDCLRVTNVERTLIDAAVRPTYSGGIFEVLAAYRAARGRASVKKIVEMLLEINYTYPYHQSIGFFLERAGFAQSDIGLLRDIPMKFDFYLDYAMRQTEYDSRWRLHIPKGF